jgi:hypothetical protein
VQQLLHQNELMQQDSLNNIMEERRRAASLAHAQQQ